MANTVKAIPEGFEGATPYLCIKGANDAIEFYKKAFGATETMRLAGPDGRIGHAEIKIGKANIMLADEHPEMGFLSPRTLGGSPVTIHIYVEDVDALAARAEAAGATVRRPWRINSTAIASGQFRRPVRTRLALRHAQRGRVERRDAEARMAAFSAGGES
jgi:PhnB protein